MPVQDVRPLSALRASERLQIHQKEGLKRINCVCKPLKEVQGQTFDADLLVEQPEDISLSILHTFNLTCCPARYKILSTTIVNCGFRPLRQLLARFLAAQPGEVASGVRTTLAATAITTHPSAGNVLPSTASARFNFRYLPGEKPPPLHACISRTMQGMHRSAKCKGACDTAY